MKTAPGLSVAAIRALARHLAERLDDTGGGVGRAQPGRRFFPKRTHELSPVDGDAPDGLSANYVALAARLNGRSALPGTPDLLAVTAAHRGGGNHPCAHHRSTPDRRNGPRTMKIGPLKIALQEIAPRQLAKKKIAIVKPDHFGDLILSTAAIRAVLASYPDAAVFLAPSNFPLGRFLFGDTCDLREISLPHLSKHSEGAPSAGVDLLAYDLVLFLRNDGNLNPAWADLRCHDYVFPVDTDDDHQTMLDYAVVSRLIGQYDIEAHHYGDDLAAVRQKASRAPNRIGLSIGSGFHANTWPAVRWIELGRRLLAEGRLVRVFCGPSEVILGRMIAGVLGLGYGGLVTGDARIEAFAREAAQMDWFVASDGGTAHLCGLFAPVTSIFGPSPFRRYAPFGRWQRLLTQELDCAPCCQWAAKLVNGCLSTECMVNIGIEQVMAGLGPPYASDIEPGMFDAGSGCRLYYGVSHLEFAEKIEERVAA
jgi:hypothetical protein